jgi:hypothetical protein
LIFPTTYRPGPLIFLAWQQTSASLTPVLFPWLRLPTPHALDLLLGQFKLFLKPRNLLCVKGFIPVPHAFLKSALTTGSHFLSFIHPPQSIQQYRL